MRIYGRAACLAVAEDRFEAIRKLHCNLQRSKELAPLLSRLAQPLSLTELAHEVGTNERRLTEEFRRYTGKAVFEYLRGERHRVACEMLLHTDKPVSTIAEATGFNATAAFTYAFRQRCGLTPSQFRASGGILAGPYPDGDARDGEEVQGAGS